MLISVNLYALDLFYGISSALDYKSGWINRFIEGLAALRWATSGYLSSWIFEDKMRGRRVFIRFLGVNSFHYISTIYLFDLVLTSLVYGISFAVAILMTSSEVEHIDMQAQYLGLSLFLTWNANLIGQNLILRTTSERMQLVSPLLIIIQYFMGYGADLL